MIQCPGSGKTTTPSNFSPANYLASGTALASISSKKFVVIGQKFICQVLLLHDVLDHVACSVGIGRKPG
jgi:hypothetical protein